MAADGGDVYVPNLERLNPGFSSAEVKMIVQFAQPSQMVEGGHSNRRLLVGHLPQWSAHEVMVDKEIAEWLRSHAVFYI